MCELANTISDTVICSGQGDAIPSRLLSLNGWMSKWCPQNNIGTRKYKKNRPNQFMRNNLIDVQQIKNVYNTEKQMIKLGLLNIRSLSTKFTFCKLYDH